MLELALFFAGCLSFGLFLYDYMTIYSKLRRRGLLPNILTESGFLTCVTYQTTFVSTLLLKLSENTVIANIVFHVRGHIDYSPNIGSGYTGLDRTTCNDLAQDLACLVGELVCAEEWVLLLYAPPALLSTSRERISRVKKLSGFISPHHIASHLHSVASGLADHVSEYGENIWNTIIGETGETGNTACLFQ